MTAPDHARLREELTAIDRRMNAHLSCLLRGGPVPVVAILEDGLRLFGLAAELLDRVEKLERLNAGLCDRVQAQSELLARRAGKAEAVPQPSLSGDAVPHENPPPPPP